MPKPARSTRLLRAVAGTFSVLCLGAGLTLGAETAWAAWVDVPDNGQVGLLELYSDPYPMQSLDLTPGAVNEWQIRASLTQDSSQLTMYFAREGVLVSHADALQIIVQMCSLEWDTAVSPATCPATLTHVIGPVPASDPSLGPMTPMFDAVTTGTPLNLGSISDAEFAFVLATVWIDDGPGTTNDTSLMGQSGEFGFAFVAEYDDAAPLPTPDPSSSPTPTEPGEPAVTPSPSPTPLPLPASPPGLASTGLDALTLVLLAGGALGLGATLRAGRSRTSTPAVTEGESP
ncbi:hypothetical protein [Demequina aurantiaca]|uniref:hypothetical protein n=1 Tax=Demequina aurantiaca TaxID=676200 RepID=UPI003D352CCF